VNSTLLDKFRFSSTITFAFNKGFSTSTLANSKLFILLQLRNYFEETAVAQWLRCCATNRKVAGSIPAGVSGFYVDIKSFRTHYGTEVDPASNRNEYREYFLGVKAAGA